MADSRPSPSPSPLADALAAEVAFWHRRQAARRVLAARHALHPSEAYVPHGVCPTRSPRAGLPSGQLQFHQSTHRHRLMWPGNGWGGTTAAAIEVAWWMLHNHPYQPTPAGPVMGYWLARDLMQFEALRVRLLEPECFGRYPRWRADSPGPRYEWPDGGVLLVKTPQSPWTSIEGVEPHFFVFDEMPPEPWFKEAMYRSRGRGQMRIWGKMTQTQGWTWMAEAIYEPWLTLLKAKGLTEEEGLAIQPDPDLWLWTTGGCYDNSNLSDEDVAYYERTAERLSRSKSERLVRLFGGCRSFTSDPVFDEDLLEKALAEARAFVPAVVSGSFEAYTDEEATEIEDRERAEAMTPARPLWDPETDA